MHQLTKLRQEGRTIILDRDSLCVVINRREMIKGSCCKTMGFVTIKQVYGQISNEQYHF